MIQLNEVLSLVGAKGQRKSLTPLHVELETLIWEMKCMVMHQVLAITFKTDCSELVKMVLDQKVWPAFSTLFFVFTSLKTCSGTLLLVT